MKVRDICYLDEVQRPHVHCRPACKQLCYIGLMSIVDLHANNCVTSASCPLSTCMHTIVLLFSATLEQIIAIRVQFRSFDLESKVREHRQFCIAIVSVRKLLQKMTFLTLDLENES